MTNRKSITGYRWSTYITPKSSKGWLKKRLFSFFNKIQFQSNKVCYKVSDLVCIHVEVTCHITSPRTVYRKPSETRSNVSYYNWLFISLYGVSLWSFCVAAPVVWYALPARLRSPSISRGQFRDGLAKTHLFLSAIYIGQTKIQSIQHDYFSNSRWRRPNWRTVQGHVTFT